MRSSRPFFLVRTGVFLALAVLTLNIRAGGGRWTVVGWNNLGMHCMDDDYSVFSILPPFNTLDVQLMDASGKLVKSSNGVTITYEAVADPDGSLNRTTVGKSNFWDYALPLYGAALKPEFGLTGVRMPGPANTPQPLAFGASFNWFEAQGIPIVPIDDAGRANNYPMMRVKARSANGTVLAQTDVVLPVSSEMDCRACHSSTSGPAARPAGGWVKDSNPSREHRLNILYLHDEKHLADPVYQAALTAKGYQSDGLFMSVTAGGKQVLCASCHASEALGTASAAGVDSLTRSMHAKHAEVINPANNQKLDLITNRSACYTCHPGSATRCLRGAMGAAVAPDGTMAMQCQSCHGTMSQVGAATRTGWLDEPSCGNCHTGSATQNRGKIRYENAFDETGKLRQALLAMFDTNANTPAPGKSLYRFSSGHGGLQCSACHGSTHAEFPSSHRNDNIQSDSLQGHAGVLADCTACHASVPNTVNGGPHGMHPIGQSWVSGHHDAIERAGMASCRACHGADDKGTVLSRAQGDRSFTAEDYGTKKFWRGQKVGCYDCHDGSGSESATRRFAAVVSNASLTLPAGAPTGSVVLTANASSPVFRIVKQPLHGTVALAGRLATYQPDPGFVGPDYFTFTANDGLAYRDSINLGIGSITVGNLTPTLDTDKDTQLDVLEYALGLSTAFPSLGTTMQMVEKINGKNYLTMSTPRWFAPPDVTLSIEVSADNKTWKPAVTLINTARLFKARDTQPWSSVKPRYMRLNAKREMPPVTITPARPAPSDS